MDHGSCPYMYLVSVLFISSIPHLTLHPLHFFKMFLYLFILGLHAASGTLYSLFILEYSLVYMYQLELVFRLLVRLQLMYLQYNVYLSIVVRTYIYIYIYTHVIQNNLRTPQLAGFARQLGCKNWLNWLDSLRGPYMATVPTIIADIMYFIQFVIYSLW